MLGLPRVVMVTPESSLRGRKPYLSAFSRPSLRGGEATQREGAET